MAKIKWDWLLGGILGTLFVGTGAYIWFSTHPLTTDFPIKKFIIGFSIVISLIFLFIGLSSIILSLFKKRTVDKLNERPKDPVSSDKALKLWKDAFMLNEGIPLRYSSDGKTIVGSINPTALIIRNSQPFVKGAENFWIFECIVREGLRVGNIVVVLPLDFGEQNITDNWNRYIKDNRTMNNFSLNDGRYPLTSEKAWLSNLNLRKSDLMDVGYSDKEARDIVGMGSALTSPVQNQIPKKNKKSANTTSDMFGGYQGFPDETSEPSISDVQDSIDAARERNLQ